MGEGSVRYSVSAILGGCSVWFVWSDERVNRTNSYSRPTTEINSHSASFFKALPDLTRTLDTPRGHGLEEPRNSQELLIESVGPVFLFCVLCQIVSICCFFVVLKYITYHLYTHTVTSSVNSILVLTYSCVSE